MYHVMQICDAIIKKLICHYITVNSAHPSKSRDYVRR